MDNGVSYPAGVYLKRTRQDRKSLKLSGTAFILRFLQLWRTFGDAIWVYFEQVLHSIFFLGFLKDITPNEFLDTSVMDSLTNRFPQMLEDYKHIPPKTPFSILLKLAKDQLQDETKVKDFLLDFLLKLKIPQGLRGETNNIHHYDLESAVFAVCYNETPGTENPVRFYGASLSCRGKEVKELFINFSCLSVWHKYVSYAVLSHKYDAGNGIGFPNTVKCRAFYRNWTTNTYEDRRPCRNCGLLFGLNNPDKNKNDYPYGNCAETECLSELLRSDTGVCENTIIKNFTAANHRQLKDKSKVEFTKLNKKVRNGRIMVDWGQC